MTRNTTTTPTTDTRAVTPAIGLVFIISFTVLAGALTIGIGLNAWTGLAIGEPNVQYEYTYNNTTNELHIEHIAGDTVQPGAHLTVTNTNPDTDRVLDAPLHSTGDTITLQNVERGDHITIEWKYYRDTATISTHTIP